MARTLTLLPVVLVSGCFHATPYSATADRDQWRSLRDQQTARAAEVSRPEQAGGPGLTADETYALALVHNPDVMALAAIADTATAEIQAERQLENPQLRITSFNIDDVIANQSSVNIGLRVPIPRPGTVRARAAAASHTADGERGLTEDAKRLLREQIDLAFAQLAVLSADLEQAERAETLRRERREQLVVRSDLAVATRVDVALAEVEQAQAGKDVIALRDAVADLEDLLARLAGLRGHVRFRIDPRELRVMPEPIERDALTERALASRPELRTAHSLIVAADAEAFVARSEAWPWFDWVQLQYRLAPGTSPAAFGFGVSIALPVLSWNRGAIKASKALVRQRKIEHDARIIAIADEVDNAADLVERTRERVRAIERDLLPTVEVATREAHAAVATGTLDPIVANDIELKAVDAQRAYLAALLEHRLAVVMLEAVVGEPLDQHAQDAGVDR